MSDFDDHASGYRDEVSESVSFTGREVDFYAERKAQTLLRVVGRIAGEPASQTFLDVGCGVGVTDGFLADRVGDLHGVDVAGEAVGQAAAANPGVSYVPYDGRRLPYEDGRFDVAFAICVLHHVDPVDRLDFHLELGRVVRPGGLVVVFEHNPLNPLTRVAVSRCEFDEGVVLAGRRALIDVARRAALEPVEHRYLLFHPIGGVVGDVTDRLLGRVPVGAQHYLVSRSS